MNNPINPTIIKNKNRQLIYQYIRNNGPVSKQDIVVDVGLSIPTVTQNLQYLRKQNYIVPSEVKKLTGGRSASTYIAQNDCRMAIGVHISQNHIAAASVNLAGSVICFHRKRIKFDISSESYLKLQFLSRRKSQKTSIEYFMSQEEAPHPLVVNLSQD